MFQNITAPTLFPIFLAYYKYIYKYINDEKCPYVFVKSYILGICMFLCADILPLCMAHLLLFEYFTRLIMKAQIQIMQTNTALQKP